MSGSLGADVACLFRTKSVITKLFSLLESLI